MSVSLDILNYKTRTYTHIYRLYSYLIEYIRQAKRIAYVDKFVFDWKSFIVEKVRVKLQYSIDNT